MIGSRGEESWGGTLNSREWENSNHDILYDESIFNKIKKIGFEDTA